MAAIFEFSGALILGRVSTNTIANGISDIKVFQNATDCVGGLVFGYGMMWTLILGGLWQGWASYSGLNVSATHSIIAGVIGFALAFRRNAVLWLVEDPKSIPPYKGIVPIVVAWFFAPIVTGSTSAMIFLITRTVVLRSESSFNRAFYVLPVFVFGTSWINIYFVFTKGAKKTFESEGADWSDSKAAWIAAVCSVGLAIVSIFCIPLLKKKVTQWEEKEKLQLEEREMRRLESINNPDAAKNSKGLEIPPAFFVDPIGNLKGQWKNLCNFDYGMDFFDDLNDKVEEMHNRAEKFEPSTEKVFGYLQVFSATCVMFAHGAGEVGYMAGPLTSIYDVYQNGKLNSKAEAPIWIIILCAFSLVFGLATYGKNVVKSVGKELAKITPTRGFAAEVATAMVIMVASQYGLPTSSSQCVTGGIVGIGIVEGMGGVNWKFFAQTFASWVVTMFVMGLGTALLFSQGHNAP